MQAFRPVRWKEGLFLRPHHLQQFELYLENRELTRARTLERHGWGLIKLVIKTESLGNYSLEVLELQAVLPDGTLVDVPGNARLASSQFQRFIGDIGKPLDVFLGIRTREDRRPQVIDGTAGQGVARFSPLEAEVYDTDSGDTRVPVEFLEYDLRCFFGSESQQGYDTMPLVRLVGTGDPAHPVTIDRAFAAPSLILHGSPALREIVRSVLEVLGKVQRELGSNRTTLQPDKLVIYQAVSACQPVLRDMANDGMIHPRRVYHELARLAGALLAAAGRTADDVPPYDHRDPLPVFQALLGVIDDKTPSVIRRPYKILPMNRVGDDWQADLPPEATEPTARCFLEANSAVLDEIPKLMTAARISSSANVDTLHRFALRGVPRRAETAPLAELGSEARGSYFLLEKDEENWNKHVVPERSLAVSWRNAPNDLELRLVVLMAPGR